MRNRWRRQKLAPELRDEVSPKNILMIGPTGCGKTEISRRLRSLPTRPSSRSEATKFTEVGYVGRDVEQIARDLVEEAVRLEKERRRAAVKDKAEEAALARLIDGARRQGRPPKPPAPPSASVSPMAISTPGRSRSRWRIAAARRWRYHGMAGRSA